MHDTLIDTHAATFTNIYVHEVEFSSKSLRTVFEARNGINQFEIIILKKILFHRPLMNFWS